MAGFIEDNRVVVLGSVAIVMVGLMGSGFLLGDGLRRAKEADREVTVKGVSERDVTADIATWTVSFSDNGPDLASVQRSVDRQAQSVRKFFTEAGFKPSDFTDSDISLMREQPRDAYGNPLPENLTVSRSIQLRTNDVMKARAAYAKQADLLRAGVEMGGGSVNYTFTGLNDLKPEMIAEANRSARESAQQFANALRIKDGGEMLGLAAGQCAAKVARRIALGQLVRHRVAKDLPDKLQRPMRLFVVLRRFIGADGFENLERLDFAHRAIAQRLCDKA